MRVRAILLLSLAFFAANIHFGQCANTELQAQDEDAAAAEVQAVPQSSVIRSQKKKKFPVAATVAGSITLALTILIVTLAVWYREDLKDSINNIRQGKQQGDFSGAFGTEMRRFGRATKSKFTFGKGEGDEGAPSTSTGAAAPTTASTASTSTTATTGASTTAAPTTTTATAGAPTATSAPAAGGAASKAK